MVGNGLVRIRRLPSGSERRWRRIERFGLIGILIGLSGLAALQAPSLLARYAAKHDLPVLNIPTFSLPAGLTELVGVSKEEYEAELIEAPYVLEIPDQRIQAAIVTNVPLDDETVYWKALTKGVALARSSAALEAETGNSFIFGHSGRITLKPSPYDTIFAALPDVKKDESVIVSINGQPTTYRVTDSRSVTADDFSVLEETSGKKTLTLMTCWPLGTWYKRWIVQAERVESSR